MMYKHTLCLFLIINLPFRKRGINIILLVYGGGGIKTKIDLTEGA